MRKRTETTLLIVTALILSAVIYTGIQQVSYQQQSTFGQEQATEPPVSNETTFRSVFDTFVSSEPGGYGIYQERFTNVFKPGDEVIIYSEPAGYTYKTLTDENGTKLYSIDMTADMMVADKNGADFGGQQDIPMTQLLSHHQNKESYLDLSVTGTDTLDPGDYVANWKVTDENSGKTFEIVKEFTLSQ